ncbi:HNM1 Choline transport protein [Candida maltosa Xu316]|uniref:Choline transport protein n=1 Tax=Candida maltosa (strain Xu316) TaxID=1245528 RepID=M3K7F8_CANMX|nr:Choline transport protein [Candida maltosa Xu316]
MSDISEKKESNYNTRISVEQGEIQNILSHRLLNTHATTNLDALAATAGGNDKKNNRLLKEAQANLELAAETGYTPELRRNFSILSLLGIGFGITNSWFGISGSLVAGISSGGPMMIIYGIIIVAFFSTCIGITLSELSSAYPNAAGQIYWAGKLAPPKYSKISSYFTGILTSAGAIFTTASVNITIGTAILGMYVLHHPEHVVERWQVFIVYELITVILFFFNVYEKALPVISKTALFVSLASFLIIIITVPSMHKGEFKDAHFVFVEFSNGTGWTSSGIAFIVGLINPNWSFSCLDAATHIAEESLTPELDIPKAILGTVLIGLITSLTYAIAMFYCIQNLTDIFESTTGVPIMDIFYQATESKAAAIGLEFLVLITACLCSIQCSVWASRIVWSFARDNGLPLSKYWAKVDTRTGNVINAHLMSTFWVMVIGCIYLGSSTAFNSVLVSCVTFLLLSYLIPTVYLVFKRNQIKHGPFWLKSVGLFANIGLICWAIFAFVFYNFPAVMPVTGSNMNYSCVVFFVCFFGALADWFMRGRHEYISPEEREHLKDELVSQMSNQVENIQSIVSRRE